jgi:hypothetical protein
VPVLFGGRSPHRRDDNPSADRARRSPGATTVLIPSTGKARSSDDAGLAANLMFEIAITKYLGRTHREAKSVWPRPNHYTPPPTADPYNRRHAFSAWSPLDLNKSATASRAACVVANDNRARRTERMKEERRLVWCVLRHWTEISDSGRFPHRDQSIAGCGERTERIAC